jgi:hypothetical protein
MKLYVIVISILLPFFYNGVTFAQEKVIKLDEATMKKLEDMQKQEEQRKKMESQMHVTRSDLAKQWAPQSDSKDSGKSNLNAEQMKRLADSIDASRGRAGIAHIPHVIHQSRELEKQQIKQKQAFNRKPQPNAIYPAKK